MLAREVAKGLKEWECGVWLAVAEMADRVESKMYGDGDHRPWVTEAITAEAEPLREQWVGGRYGQPPISPAEVLADLAGDYAEERGIFDWLPTRLHRSCIVDELAYALLCLAVEKEIEKRTRRDEQASIEIAD